MANTIDADLLIDTLADRVITTLGPKLAPLNAFTRDFSKKTYCQTKSVQVQVTTGGSTTQTNPTSFESGDSTTDNVAVTMNHYSNSFHVTSAQLNEQITLESLADRNLQNLANKIVDVAMTPIDATNFANASGNIAQTAIVAGDLQAGWGSIGTSDVKNILLDAVAYSKFLPTSTTSLSLANGAYGFDGFYLNTRWTGAVAGTYGFVCGPDAIAQASGIPDIAPAVQKMLFGSKVVTVPGLGISVQLNVWGSTSSRAVWASYDVMYGAAFGKQGAATGYRIKSS
jgi:hypothetical protein